MVRGEGLWSAAPPSRAIKGFTLIEAIISVTLLSVILVGLHTMLWVGTRAHRRSRQAAERSTVQRSVIEVISEDLHRLSLQIPESPASLVVVREDDRCLLRLRTNARVAPGQRPMLVDYFLAPGQDDLWLVRRYQPLQGVAQTVTFAEASGEDQGLYEVLAGGVESFAVRGFDGQEWRDEWNAAAEGTSPRAVEVRMTFAGADGPWSFTRVMDVPVTAPVLAAGREDGS